MCFHGTAGPYRDGTPYARAHLSNDESVCYKLQPFSELGPRFGDKLVEIRVGKLLEIRVDSYLQWLKDSEFRYALHLLLETPAQVKTLLYNMHPTHRIFRLCVC